MKILIHKSTTPVGAIIAAFAVLLALAVFLITGRVGAVDSSTNTGHLVTFHDRGTQIVISSNAETIEQALTEAGITLDSSDAVEPAAGEKLVAKEYDVNIYRARPVIVVDGTTRQKIVTPYQSAKQIAKSAGITLYDEDTTVLSRTNDIVSEGAGLRLTIDRATPFNFTLYGKTTLARTQAVTVGDMLKEKGIVLGQDDRVSPDTSALISPASNIRVWREGKQTITVDEEVNFAVETIQDGDQYVGYHAVKTPGVKGSRSVTYEVLVQDGVEVGRIEIASITLTESQKQVEVAGAKYRGAYTTPSENESITWNYLQTHGFSREQTAGIMGNLMQEHHFNTTGDGLAQWTGSRKAALMSLPDPYSIYTQLDFLMSEFNGGYARVRDEIRATGSVVTAVQIFQNRFERCGVCMEGNRIQFAYNILASH